MITALFFCLVTLQQSGVPATAPAAPPAQRVSGAWTLNKDLSTKPATLPSQNGRSGDRGGGGGRRGGFGGGRMGGGRSGGGVSGGGRNGGDNAKGMALIRELGQSPETLTIVLKDAVLTMTDSDGVSRKFSVDNKTEKVAIGGDDIEVKSHWADEAIEQEFKVGSTKLVRLIETTTDGHQLVITVRPKEDDGAGRFDRFVYDRKPLLQ